MTRVNPALLRAAASNPLVRYIYGLPGKGGMAPFQREFHAAQHADRCQLAATKLGKTYGGSAEAWLHLLGWHPLRPVPAVGSLGLILCPDHTSGWTELSAVMHKLEPPDILDPSCRYVADRGYIGPEGRRCIITKHGSRAYGFGCTQDLQALEGWDAQWAWVNEVPKKAHYDALVGRLSTSGGPLWITTTPIGKPTEWLREKVEGIPEEGQDPTEPGWWVQHAVLSVENAPHRTPESIQKQIDRCDAWERRQRIEAQWDGATPGRKLAAFSDAHLVATEDLPEFDWLRLGWDYGEGEGKTICSAVFGHGRRVYLVRQAVSTEDLGFSPRVYARQALDMLAGLGLSIHHVSKAVGDTNSAGLANAGLRFNALMERALAAELGMTHCPVDIEPAIKTRGAPKASISALNAKFREGEAFVHESCTKFVSCARHFTGKEADMKDAIDSFRYPIMDILLPHGASAPSVDLVL